MSDKIIKGTDTEHEVKLESAILESRWTCARASAGRDIGYIVRTTFVGDGGPIQLEMKNDKGKTLAKVSTVIDANILTGTLTVPADIEMGDGIVLLAKLSKHGLSMESDRVPVEVASEVTDMKWSVPEARRGDLVDLICKTKNVRSGTPVELTIWEFDSDGAHDRITDISTTADADEIQASWAFEYHEDTDEMPTKEDVERYGGTYNPPEYFFTAEIDGTVFGKQQESGILNFKDWLLIKLHDEFGKPWADEPYRITFADGSVREGRLDADGMAREEDLPPGQATVEYPEL